MATRPLGKEIQQSVQLMDLQHGPMGITISQLKQVIQKMLSISQYSRPLARDRERSWDRQPAFAPRPYRPNVSNLPQYQNRRQGAIAPREKEQKLSLALNAPNAPPSREMDQKQKQVATPKNDRLPAVQFSRKMRVGVGPTPCFVCGTDKHSWLSCPKKKKGRCACCGSEGHPTRNCAQRLYPKYDCLLMFVHQWKTRVIIILLKMILEYQSRFVK